MKGKKTHMMKKGGMVKGAAKMENKMKAPVKKMGKKEMAVDGKKSMKRLDKMARGGKSGGGRPNAEGMSADSPMSTAAKGKKSEDDGPAGYKRGGKLDAKERNALPSKDFALPGRKYPINNESHGRNALSRVAQNGSPEEKKKVRAAVHRKFPGIKQKGE